VDYRDLTAWQKAMDLVEHVYRATVRFPKEELYGLKSQMRRAAVSIPSNIAEGQGRRTTNEEFNRYLSIALGSLCELETQTELTLRLKILDKQAATSLRKSSGEVGRLINGLMNSRKN
jgi:four helix bundle protein